VSRWRVQGTPQRAASRVSLRPNLAVSKTMTASDRQPTDSIVLKRIGATQ